MALQTFLNQTGLEKYTELLKEYIDTKVSVSASDSSKLPLTGGTVTGTLVLNKNQDVSGLSDTRPALVIGGEPTGDHIQIDNNEIQSKINDTTVGPLWLNNDGGDVNIGGPINAYKDVTVNGLVKGPCIAKYGDCCIVGAAIGRSAVGGVYEWL